jgi:hypothetical protein
MWVATRERVWGGMDETSRVAHHISSLVAMGMKKVPTFAAAPAQPVLEGFASQSEDARTTLTRFFISEAGEYTAERTEKPARFLARIALSGAKWLHRASCSADRRRAQSCIDDARAIEHVVRGIALSLLDLEMHDDIAPLITSAANARDLTEIQRLDGLAAKVAEILHPHHTRRSVLEIIEGSPIFQFNTPIRDVDRKLYRRNRLTVQEFAQIPEAAGFRLDITSDYASPDHPAPGQEYLLRSGLLRAAATVFVMNGAGPGTGRAIELGANALTPILLLRRVSAQDPPPPNDDRHTGETTGIPEILFSTDAQGRELLEGFLSSNATSIAARQRNLVALENGPIPEEMHRVLGADPSAFYGARMTIEEARFWVEPLHLPFAGDARMAEIRRVLGMTSVHQSTSKRALHAPSRDVQAEVRSRQGLAAYARLVNLAPERTLLLWDARLAYGPSQARRDTPLGVEDWADIDRRLPNP